MSNMLLVGKLYFDVCSLQSGVKISDGINTVCTVVTVGNIECWLLPQAASGTMVATTLWYMCCLINCGVQINLQKWMLLTSDILSLNIQADRPDYMAGNGMHFKGLVTCQLYS